MTARRTWDVFISHASEDKETVARPLARSLQQHGLTVWLDETALVPGGSLTRSIDEGLARSRYGVVVISPAFMRKRWPQDELAGLRSKAPGSIIPVWHDVTRDEVAQWSPMMVDLVALPWTANSPEDIRMTLLSTLQIEFDVEAPLAGLWRGLTGRMRLFCVRPDGRISGRDSVNVAAYVGDYDWKGHEWVGHITGQYSSSERLFRFEWTWGAQPNSGHGYFCHSGESNSAGLSGGWGLPTSATDGGNTLFERPLAELTTLCPNQWTFERPRDGRAIHYIDCRQVSLRMPGSSQPPVIGFDVGDIENDK